MPARPWRSPPRISPSASASVPAGPAVPSRSCSATWASSWASLGGPGLGPHCPSVGRGRGCPRWGLSRAWGAKAEPLGQPDLTRPPFCSPEPPLPGPSEGSAGRPLRDSMLKHPESPAPGASLGGPERARDPAQPWRPFLGVGEGSASRGLGRGGHRSLPSRFASPSLHVALPCSWKMLSRLLLASRKTKVGARSGVVGSLPSPRCRSCQGTRCPHAAVTVLHPSPRRPGLPSLLVRVGDHPETR